MQPIIDGLTLGLIYSIAASGLSLAFGVMHIVNVSHGDFIILGAYISYTIWVMLGFNPLVALLPAAIVLGVIGYISQKYLVYKLIGGPPLATLVLFFGLSISIPNIVIIVWGPYSRTIIDSFMFKKYDLFFISLTLGKILTILVSLAILLGLLYFLYRTQLGVAIRASSQNREGALVCGIDVNKIYQITMAISFALAGVSGVLIAVNSAFTPVQGPVYTLLSFLIVVLGGMGYVPGSIVSAFFIGIAQSMISSFLGSTYVYALVFVILYLSLLIMPRGILGKGI